MGRTVVMPAEMVDVELGVLVKLGVVQRVVVAEKGDDMT